MTKRYAVVFPGQGSQKVGMLAEIAPSFAVIQETFAEASQILGYDLWDIVQNDADKLNQTQYTQLAMLVADVALWRVWQQQHKPAPALVAGHSLGEFSALVAAEIVSFSDAVRLVQVRAESMQAAVKPGAGAMAAIVGLDDDVVRNICKTAQAQGIVSPANYNSVGQVVIAGEIDAVKKALELAQAQGAKVAKIIPVSVPCHCDLMKPALSNLSAAIEGTVFNAPAIPIVQNVDGAIHDSIDEIKQNLIAQLYSPVQWVQSITAMVEDDISEILEMGPGKVLCGLIRRINPNVKVQAMNDVTSLEIALTSV